MTDRILVELERVRKAGEAMRVAERRRAQKSADRLAAILAARDAGAGYLRIAKAARISKSAVQSLLRDSGERQTLPEEEDAQTGPSDAQEHDDGVPGGQTQDPGDEGADQGDEAESDLPAGGGGVDPEGHHLDHQGGPPAMCRHGVRWGRCCTRA